MAIVYKSESSGVSDFRDTNNQSYWIDMLQYPSNLESSPEYGKNKVAFFINVQGQGKFASNDQNSMELMDIPESEYTKVLAGRAVIESVGELAKKAGIDLTVAKKMKRLASAIVLYTPVNVRTSYSTTWSEDDFQSEEFYAESALALGKMAAEPSWDQAESTTKTILGGVAAKTLNGMNYVQRATQMTPGNAKAEQLFKGVNFREFMFDYQFAPKSQEEAKNILNIIRMFRYHMLPEFKDQASFLYIYPSEFEIKFYKGAKENEFIERYMTCVLTNVIVDYTPNGQFNTFANGMPTQINMTLNFKELALTTKETSPYDRQGV